MKHWYIYNKKADFKAIADKFHISPVLARIIRNRDVITEEEIGRFLKGDLTYLYDPFLMKGVKEACSILSDAILTKEKIRIVGDYDIDGICASYILFKALSFAGGDADICIPDRFEDGYGINESIIDKAFCDGISLIITCDNGIRAFAPTERARELGLKMIITDHHEAADVLPDADAVIDPHCSDSGYPFKDLCGAAVAFKVIEALFSYLHISLEPIFDELLLFAGFATVGDVVPLLDENRILAKEGLKRLRNCTNTGMNALIGIKQLSKEELDSYHIGFILGPCINSAGRLKDASLALSLLMESDEEEAVRLAQELSELNETRKRITEQQTLLARNYFDDRIARKGYMDKVMGIYLEEAHESVAGIVAGRLKELYYRPVFVVTKTEQGLKGSGRSIESYDMIGEISKVPQFFEKYGGHKMACGFTLKEGAFYDLLDALDSNWTPEEKDLVQKTWIDMQLPVAFVTEELINELEQLKPYGQNNSRPLFADKDLTVNRFMVMGKNKNTLKLFLETSSGYKAEAVMFGSAQNILNKFQLLTDLQKEKGSAPVIACLYYPRINEFKGMRSIQLVISDLDVSK